MEIISKQTYEDHEGTEIYYKLSNSIQVKSFVEIVKQYEQTHNAVLEECACHSFREYCSFYDADSILEKADMYFENPFIDFFATFVDKRTGRYLFDLSTSTPGLGSIFNILHTTI